MARGQDNAWEHPTWKAVGATGFGIGSQLYTPDVFTL
jgi:hypothetical protein